LATQNEPPAEFLVLLLHAIENGIVQAQQLKSNPFSDECCAITLIPNLWSAPSRLRLRFGNEQRNLDRAFD
jgi:hypothetical protein